MKLEAICKDALGFKENKEATIEGGATTGEALNTFDKRTQQKVVSDKKIMKMGIMKRVGEESCFFSICCY